MENDQTIQKKISRLGKKGEASDDSIEDSTQDSVEDVGMDTDTDTEEQG